MSPHDPYPTTGPPPGDRSPWWIDRDVDAVTAYLDVWITAAGLHDDGGHAHPAGPAGSRLPLLGTPEWIASDEPTRRAAVAVYVIAALAEREPVVIAARLAAEIAATRLADQHAHRQAGHAIAAAGGWTALARRPSHAEITWRRHRPGPLHRPDLDPARKESA